MKEEKELLGMKEEKECPCQSGARRVKIQFKTETEEEGGIRLWV